MPDSFKINQRLIGKGQSCYIIAEMSANHGQDLAQAMDLVRAAKDAGTDCIKLQTYTADTLTIDSSASCFKIGQGTIWEGKNLYDLYKEAYTPWDWQPKIKELADSLGLDCFSTPFDSSAIKFLEGMQVPAYKIASFEIVDLKLIAEVAATGKPVIISTGMATLEEIEEAVTAFREAGGTDLALLKCSSGYPALPTEMNLRAIPDLVEKFNVPVGLSDHTLGISAAVAAVALGACIIEKHFTLDRSVRGPDSSFSLEPREFKAMVEAVRTAEQALGEVSYSISPKEKASRAFRRSLFAVEDIAAGKPLTAANVRSIRPSDGLPPRELCAVLKTVAAIDIKRGTPLSWDLLKKDEQQSSRRKEP